jgi:hypothetical protein
MNDHETLQVMKIALAAQQAVIDNLVSRVRDLEFRTGLEFPDPHEADEVGMRLSAAEEQRERFNTENKL